MQKRNLMTLEAAKEIIHDAVSNTLIDLKLLGAIGDTLSKLTLSYMHGRGNSKMIYDNFLLSQRDSNTQDNIIDFLFEVYYHICAHGYDKEYFLDIEEINREYLSTSELTDPIKGMASTDISKETDVLYGVLVFLRIFLKQFETELIIRNNLDQKFKTKE